VANKIFTTFTSKDNLEQTLDKIKINYTILYSKIFVFSSPETEEFICTYNVDQNNCTKVHIIENTLLLHRKKATKTLFSINAINILNEMYPENGGEIKWEDYKESILLTRRGVFTVVPIQLHDIIFVN
jgi:hypothetical protein